MNDTTEEKRHHTRRHSDFERNIMLWAAVATIAGTFIANIIMITSARVALENRMTRLETNQRIIMRQNGILDERETRLYLEHGDIRETNLSIRRHSYAIQQY